MYRKPFNFKTYFANYGVKTKEIKEKEDKSFRIIEKGPVFPGCEEFINYTDSKNNKLRDCMTQRIQEHIHYHYSTELGSALGLKGVQNIIVTFTIDETGGVTDIIAKGPHLILETEAARVVSLLPKMIPGDQRGKKIPVTYTLPIRVEVK